MMPPLVSILIPTYNQPEFFRQALESALSQDYQNLEILVSDDSTDDRVEKVASQYKDRIRFFKHEKSRDENLGYENMIFLLNQARGEFVNFLHHDDLFLPNKISTMMQYFNEDVAFVTSRRYAIDAHGNILRTMGLENFTSSSIFFTCEEVGYYLLSRVSNFVGELSSILMRREDLWCEQNRRYEICRFLNLSRMIANCDIPTYLEICRKKPERNCIFLKEPLSAFRRHSEQNGYDFNIIMDTFFEWIAMISTAYRSKIFLTSEEMLRDSCKNFLTLATDVIREFADFEGFDEQHACKIDSLIQILDSCEKNDLNRFLKLTGE